MDLKAKHSFFSWFCRLVGPGVVMGCLAGCSDRVDASRGALDRLLGPSRDAVPAGVDDTYDAFIDACRRADAPAAWSVFGPPLREQLDARAQEVAAASSSRRLREEFGHADHKAGFDGTALLAALLRADDGRDPCDNAELWRRIEAGEATAGGYYLVAERPDGTQQGLRMTLDGATDRWMIAELTRPFSQAELEAMDAEPDAPTP